MAGQARQSVRSAMGGQGQGGGNGAAVATRDDGSVRQLLDSMRGEFEKQLPAHIRPEYFIRAALSGLKNSKQAAALGRCKRDTLLGALMECARYGLMPFTDEATIVPFGQVATFIPQYQGLVQMFYRTGQVAKVTAKLIAQADEWAEGYGDGEGFYHKPRRFTDSGEAIERGSETNPWILAYCYVTLRDGSRTEVEVVDRFRAEFVRDTYSRSYEQAEKSWDGKPARKDSPWHTNFWDMALKTAVRQEAKWAPKSPELIDLLAKDAAADRREDFRPGGPASSWLGDVEFGSDIVEGEVVHDGDQGGGQGESTAAEKREQATANQDVARAPAAAESKGEPRTVQERDKALRQFAAILKANGFGDAGGQAGDRLAILATFAADEQAAGPVAMASWTELDVVQCQRAASVLKSWAAECGAHGVGVGDALRGVVSEYWAFVQAPADEKPGWSSPAARDGGGDPGDS